MTNKEVINELAEMGNILQIIPSTRKGQALKMAIKALNAEPIRPKGEWLLIGHDDTCNFYRCSFCGYEEHDNFTKHHNFCPSCGADMRELKDILHKAIDNTKIAEDVYPNLRKELHEAVDSADMRGENGM